MNKVEAVVLREAARKVGVSANLGIVTASAEATEEVAPRGAPAQITAAFNVADNLNPYSTLVPITRVEGITRAIVAPQTGKSLIKGQGVLVDLDGLAIARNPVAMFAVRRLSMLVCHGAGRSASTAFWRSGGSASESGSLTGSFSSTGRCSGRAYCGLSPRAFHPSRARSQSECHLPPGLRALRRWRPA